MDDALADKAKLAPSRPLSGWGFPFSSNWDYPRCRHSGDGRVYPPLHRGPGARVSPLRRGFPFMQPLHPATTMPTGAYLAGPPPGAGAAVCPSARRRRRFSCRQKVLKWGRAALQPLKPPLTAARLPSSPGQWDGVVRCARPRSSAQTFAILPWAGGRGSIHHLATKPALQIARGRPATRALAYVPSELRLHRHNQPGFFFA